MEDEDSDSENEFNKVEFFQPSIFNKYQNNLNDLIIDQKDQSAEKRKMNIQNNNMLNYYMFQKKSRILPGL